MRYLPHLAALFIILVGIFFTYAQPPISTSITGFAVFEPAAVAETASHEPVVLFCPRDACRETFLFLINNSDTVDCAFFDLDVRELIALFAQKQHRLVIDVRNFNDTIAELNSRPADGKRYMHDKFCILDGSVVVTGSMNPTYNDMEKNNNNLIIISSTILAENYQAEFEELWNGVVNRGSATKNQIIILNNKTIENYFCPEDGCEKAVVTALKQAKESIYFMAFSFTNKKIAETLIQKNADGIIIRGVMEKQQNSKHSVFSLLQKNNISVQLDPNKYKMHHKVFIIDNKTVITGSMNPTGSGAWGNDENILIMHDPALAEKFVGEFKGLFQQ